jgi:hypothetical protein
MRMELLQANVSENVYRCDGEADLPQHIRPTVKHPPFVNLWGCFSYKGVGRLCFVEPQQSMNSVWYRNILQNEVFQTLYDQFGGVQYASFQDDGAPCHRSKIVAKKCQQLGIRRLEWVGQSPDCNPIENLWGFLKRKVRARNPQTVSALKSAILEVWHTQISLQYCQLLCTSMTRRLSSVVKHKGFSTKY